MKSMNERFSLQWIFVFHSKLALLLIPVQFFQPMKYFKLPCLIKINEIFTYWDFH